MDYTLNFVSSNSDFEKVKKTPLFVPAGKTNNDTSLVLAGYGYANYGPILWQNFLKLLDNFASVNPPDHDKSTVGQLWYDTGSGKLKIFDGGDYGYISGDDNNKFTQDNLKAMLGNLQDSDIPSVFNNKYIKTKDASYVSGASISFDDITTLTYDKTITTEDHPSTLVNKQYVDSALSGDISVNGNYLPTAGGSMKIDANIILSGNGTVRQAASPTKDSDLVPYGFLQKKYMSIAGDNVGVGNIKMSGYIELNSNNCNTFDDSNNAVCAAWVMEKIKANSGGDAKSSYIKVLSPEETYVSNPLVFQKDYPVLVNTVGPDPKSVINIKYLDERIGKKDSPTYIKKAGDDSIGALKLTSNPPTDLTDTTVVTAGWFDAKLKAMGGMPGLEIGTNYAKLGSLQVCWGTHTPKNSATANRTTLDKFSFPKPFKSVGSIVISPSSDDNGDVKFIKIFEAESRLHAFDNIAFTVRTSPAIHNVIGGSNISPPFYYIAIGTA